MSNTATRLITLIMLLQRKPNQKAADLALELGVSVRSIHRYMVMLDEMGIPIYSERGPHGGFSLVRGYRMPPLVFTPEEAVAVYLGTGLVREMWGRLYEDAARGALAKLDNVLPHEQRHEVSWARRKLAATGFNRSDLDALSPLLERLRRAIRERRQVRLVYWSRNEPEPAPRIVDPYALVHRWGWWYAIAYCQRRCAIRTFRVDRIIESALLNSSFEEPPDFDLHAYLGSRWQDEPYVEACMRFPPEFAQIALYDQSGWDSVAQQPDGSVIVRFTTPTMEWAASTALSFGGAAEVLEPAELRAQVREWALATAALHDSPVKTG